MQDIFLTKKYKYKGTAKPLTLETPSSPLRLIRHATPGNRILQTANTLRGKFFRSCALIGQLSRGQRYSSPVWSYTSGQKIVAVTIKKTQACHFKPVDDSRLLLLSEMLSDQSESRTHRSATIRTVLMIITKKCSTRHTSS